jgi:hypothetical protein
VAALSNHPNEGTDMSSNTKKDDALTSTILFAAWLIIIMASAGTQSPTEAVQIAYVAE